MFDRLMPSEAAIASLRTQLGGLAAGCSEDFVTPLLSCLGRPYDDGRDKLAQLWWDYGRLTDVPSHLLSHERAQREKHGSYSKVLPYRTKFPGGDSLEDGVRKFFTVHRTRLNPRAIAVANGVLASLVPGGTLRLASLVDAALSFQKRANCGWPNFVAATASPWEYFHEAERILADSLDRSHAMAYPGVLGTRSQPRGRGAVAKSRVVFGCSRVHNILKKRVFIPVFAALSRSPIFAAWRSRRAVDEAVTRVLDSTVGGLCYSVDFSNFDASVPFEVIDVIFDTLCYWFDSAATPLINFCRECFKWTGIYAPDAYHHGDQRLGGVPSGSVLTNLVDSLVNVWLMAYAAHRCRGRIVHCLVQGDDGVYRFEGVPSIDDLSTILSDECGMNLSPAKTCVSAEEVCYLQMVHHTSYRRDGLCVGVRPLMRVLNGMMSFEKGRRKGWLPEMNTLRWLQQLDNASAHPCFPFACEWLLNHDYLMPSVLVRILENDQDLLNAASEVLGFGDDGKVRIRDLYRSPVFTVCSQLALKQHPLLPV
jgi:hypothetical protein